MTSVICHSSTMERLTIIAPGMVLATKKTPGVGVTQMRLSLRGSIAQRTFMEQTAIPSQVVLTFKLS